jgi:hypothetical protein
MAEATIRRYIDHMRRAGAMEVQQAWKRVQAGYLLSEYLYGDEDLNKYTNIVAEMIHSKAGVQIESILAAVHALGDVN